MESILAGAELLLQPEALSWLVLGLLIGFLVGAIPGVGAPNAAALLLPFAVGLAVESSLLLICGLYAGALFASAIPAILVNAPGEPGSGATALDGYPLAMQGQAERAIGIARMASVIGGVLAGLVVLMVIGPLGNLALRFGAAEIFIVALFGLTVIAVTVGDDIRKGLISAGLGLLIASMAANPYTGEPRFTMGFPELYGEVPFVPAVIGIFGVAQMLMIASQDRLGGTRASGAVGNAERTLLSGLSAALREVGAGIAATFRYPITLLRSSGLGLLIGIVPGMGTSTANFVSYGVAKQFSKQPKTFGKGNPEGIVASESCDNAVGNGSLIPTLALGIPGSATMAIVLAALYLHGIQPGPRLIDNEAPLVYALVLALILCSLLILPIGAVLAAPMALVTRVRPPFLVPAVLVCCIVGTYSFRNSMFDVGLMLIFGVLSFVMQRLGYPIVPLVLGLVLGPIAEESMLRALQLGNYELSYFFSSGISQILWAGLLVTLVLSTIRSIRTTRQRRLTEAEVS
ncbi:tripartite tricarboxylate transporter permease [Nesterenkonia alba]|uniref:tripartite tricarboxylate transporter permease n=1 Tax=Nesterenkonia alba TaxID=515814 RepID=UPI0003B38680|nr:tripartite tricarboxylate transporter permease [Nesterenkonia alba]